jgi:hypothetical protein
LGACNAERDTRRRDAPAIVERALHQSGFAWTSVASPHFRVHAVAGGPAAARIDTLAGAAERALREIRPRLGGVDLRDSADLFFVDDPEAMGKLVGRSVGGWTVADARAVFILQPESGSPALRHELAHLLTWTAWGGPSASWISEGVAVYATGGCAGRSLHEWAASVANAGRDIPLDSLARTFDFAEAIPHFEAASFVQYVVEQHGIGAVRVFWSNGLDGAKQATGRDAAEIEEQWRKFLRRPEYRQPAFGPLDPTGRVSCE